MRSVIAIPLVTNKYLAHTDHPTQAISRVLSWPIISLWTNSCELSRAAGNRAFRPDRRKKTTVPIPPCNMWGLPGHLDYSRAPGCRFRLLVLAARAFHLPPPKRGCCLCDTFRTSHFHTKPRPLAATPIRMLPGLSSPNTRGDQPPAPDY